MHNISRSQKAKLTGIILPIVTAILGFFADAVLGSIELPLTQPRNIPYITYFVNSFLFFVISIYSVVLWSDASKRSEETFQRIDALSECIGLNISYIPVARDESGGYTHMTKIVEQAESEVLILNYELVRKHRDAVKYGMRLNEERQQYYDVLRQKLDMAKPGSFRYRRIFQVEPGTDIISMIADDQILMDHCLALAKEGERRPEFGSIKKSPAFYNGTFAIVDDRYVYWPIQIHDPDEPDYYTRAWLLVDDPTSYIPGEFKRFFDRVDAHATLVRISELDPQSRNIT